MFERGNVRVVVTTSHNGTTKSRNTWLLRTTELRPCLSFHSLDRRRHQSSSHKSLFGSIETADEAIELSKDLGFPLLVRPSYVLGGQSMKIVINDEELERQVLSIFKHMPDNKVLIDQFLERAREAEIDAICDGKNVHVMGIMEHVEPAGIHSGDSSAVLPPYSLSDEIIQTMIEYTKKLALALNIKGLINIQFAISQDNEVFVIEANPRASRTVPFIAKAYQEPYVNYATKVMLGDKKVTDFNFNPVKASS